MITYNIEDAYTLKDENGNLNHLIYEIIQNNAGNIKQYGFQISKYRNHNTLLMHIETEQELNVTNRPEIADNLFEILKKHTVTPIALLDVIDDFLDELSFQLE